MFIASRHVDQLIDAVMRGPHEMVDGPEIASN